MSRENAGPRELLQNGKPYWHPFHKIPGTDLENTNKITTMVLMQWLYELRTLFSISFPFIEWPLLYQPSFLKLFTIIVMLQQN